MKIQICFVGAFAGLMALLSPVHAAKLGDAPKTFYLDGRSLQETRRKVLENDPSLTEALVKIRRDADVALRQKLVAVTDKTFAAPSGNKHDYLSLSIYFWPNPATADGLPYVLRDGKMNPENRDYDSD